MDLGTLKTDQQLENEGAWVDLDSTTQIKVASTSSRSYRKVARKKIKAFNNVIQSVGIGAIPDEEQESITIETLVEGVLLGWRSQNPKEPNPDKNTWPQVIFLDQEPIEFSREAARKLLTEIPRFRYMVADLAGSIETFKTVDRGEAIKN